SGRCRQYLGALALRRAVLVSETVRHPVSAPRVVRHPRSGAWAFLARLVCGWPWLVEKRGSTDVRGVASPGPPVPAARRIRPLISDQINPVQLRHRVALWVRAFAINKEGARSHRAGGGGSVQA